MKFSPSLLCLAIAASCLPSSIVRADETALLSDRVIARRDLSLALMELRNYWQVEYPRQQRHLNAAIELTEAEICDYKARLWEWGAFSRFSTGQPFLITIQETRMCLRDAELRLQDLWAERNALVRFHSDQWRVLELKVYDARLRVAQIEAELEQPAVTTTADRPAI